MERLACTLVFVAAFGLTSAVQPEPAHLATVLDTDDSQTSLKAALQASISSLALPEPVEAAAAAKATDVKVQGDDKGKDGQQGTGLMMPVSHQISKDQMDKLILGVSTGCGLRLQKMMNGEGDNLHKFASPGVVASSLNCAKLDGVLCHTDVEVVNNQNKGKVRRRNLNSKMTSSGNSCLPTECVTHNDLSKLTQFMLKQALTVIPGDDHKIDLHVDCSQYGGANVDAGTIESGSTLVSPTAAALSAVLVLVQLATVGL